MTQIVRSDSGALAQEQAAPMQRLDPYAAGGVAAQAGRLAPLAIVSLGFRLPANREGGLGLPRATRREDERWLHLHDPDQRAPGLAEALEAGAYRRLTIAFPLDQPRAFIQQTFVRWSATALEIYGDANGLYVIDTRVAPEHRFVPPTSPDFTRLVRTCKADTRMYFALAEWLNSDASGEPQSRVLFPDGFGWYCFRSTGRHTAAEIIGYLENFRTFTRGRLAGIPFDLTVVFREVAGPDGKKRMVPIANVVARPPAQTVLDSKTFRVLATAGLEEGRNLQLPALPSPAELAAEGPPELEDDVPQAAVERLAAGDFPCDYNLVVRTWHAIVRGTPLESDEARAVWLRGWSRGDFESLTAVKSLTQREATQMLADLADGVSDVRQEFERARQNEHAATYDRIFGSAYPEHKPSVPAISGDAGAPGAGSVPEESTVKGEAQQPDRRVGNASTSGADPAPQATEPEQPMVKSVRHAMYQRLSELIQEAAEMDIPTADYQVVLPVPQVELETKLQTLGAEIARMRRQIAGQLEDDETGAMF